MDFEINETSGGVKALVNGIECMLFYDRRIPPDKAPAGYPYMYHIRHDEDNWTHPISIEKFVLVNFFGTIFTGEPLEFGNDEYIEIEHFTMERNYIEFKIRGTIIKRIFGI